MKELPKKIWRQDLPSLNADMRQRFEVARDKALTLIRPVTTPDDGRKGFGTVYAVGPLRKSALTLGEWHWRRVDDRRCSTAIGAARFVDDPMGATPTDSLAQRMAVASAFAEALNSLSDPEDVRFVARPLEVVLASVERPEGIHPGDQADVLAVDLMAGSSVPQVIGRMIREEYNDDPPRTIYLESAWTLQKELWHRLERLNAVRAMFDPKLRQIAVPNVDTVRRHLVELQKTLDAG